jgi:hypothetical protein
MRIVTLRLGDGTLPLHPRITVMAGLDHDRRAAIVDAVAGLARGAVPDGVSGFLDAHGVQFDFDERVIAALDLPAGLDAVLRPTDLPGASIPAGELRERLERARMVLDERAFAAAAAEERLAEARASDALAEGRPGLAAEVDARQAELTVVEHALAAVRSDTVSLGEHERQAVEEAHDAVVEAEERVAHARLPNPAARRRLREAERAELAVLARFELPSYGAYLLRTSTMHVDPETSRRLADLYSRRAEAEKAVAEALDDLARCDAVLSDSERAKAEAQSSLEDARSAQHEARAAVDDLEERLAAAGINASPTRVDGSDIEVYVLARLAGARAGGCVGSVPLVVDDALLAAPEQDRPRILDLLDRLAVVVQVVYLTDDGEVVEWARSLGGERAAVIAVEGTSGPSTA